MRELHRIAPELIWAKDPIAKVLLLGKNPGLRILSLIRHLKTWAAARADVPTAAEAASELPGARMVVDKIWGMLLDDGAGDVRNC